MRVLRFDYEGDSQTTAKGAFDILKFIANL